MSSREFRTCSRWPHGAVLLTVLWLCFNPVALADDRLVLTARPGLCILPDADTPQCVMGVALEWRGPTGDYCLYQSGRREPLACWEGSRAGESQARVASPQDVSFWLQEEGSVQALAQITVRVVRLAQQRPERRRRRHAWAPL